MSILQKYIYVGSSIRFSRWLKNFIAHKQNITSYASEQSNTSIGYHSTTSLWHLHCCAYCNRGRFSTLLYGQLRLWDLLGEETIRLYLWKVERHKVSKVLRNEKRVRIILVWLWLSRKIWNFQVLYSRLEMNLLKITRVHTSLSSCATFSPNSSDWTIVKISPQLPTKIQQQN